MRYTHGNGAVRISCEVSGIASCARPIVAVSSTSKSSFIKLGVCTSRVVVRSRSLGGRSVRDLRAFRKGHAHLTLAVLPSTCKGSKFGLYVLCMGKIGGHRFACRDGSCFTRDNNVIVKSRCTSISVCKVHICSSKLASRKIVAGCVG